ncbi:DUF397 domain-containing protein [Streptomyces sp. 8K308]|uniref:DUF397 domain-containing protein n=1 Tax=Streptomyces sp. 8K308 TaxID=2530388 RepID=UPI001044C37B|nr:DUF397 domain-containing protein [Streptomyces sp. 8K308]TDC25488.1 DUF397 domain-containing protein [Streptomyces sp. 8K308]
MRARPLDLNPVVWRKSSYSDNTGGDCVEVADRIVDVLPVRDSKNPDAAVLLFEPAAWGAFLEHVR